MNSQLTIALHILGFLASRGGESLTSEEMARTYGTSPVVLRRVLSKLQRAGLVETRRGVGGGSVLARNANAIHLREVYEAVTDSPEILRRHTGDCTGVVAPVLAGYVNELYAEAEQALLAKLEAVTIAEMDRVVGARIRAAVRAEPIPD
ncbi:MAG: Rrf2 family transcriptional regulator [Rubricoccaceae bacterium]